MNDQLPLNWEYRRLADVADVVSGGTPSRDVEAFWQPSEIEWVTPTDITREKTRTLKEAKEKISQKGLSNSSAKLLPINTVLMTSRATLGEMKVSASECCTNQGFKSLIPRAKTDVWFLYYQMMRKKPEYEALGIGSTFLEVNKKDTDSFLIEFPPYDQQQKIAKILTTVDNLIEKTQALIDKYTAIKQGMMADLFTRGIDLSGTPDTNPCHGQLRPPYEQAPELYKETELGWVPKEWVFTNLGAYIEKYLYGPRFDAGLYNVAGNVKTIRGTDFTKDGHILYDQVPVAEIPNSKIRHHILRTGDLVVITTADCGLTAVFEEQGFAYIPSAYAVKLKLNEDVYPYYIKVYMQTYLANQQINKYVRQGTLGNLPGSDLLRFLISMPDMKEQVDIIRKILAVDNLISKEKSYSLKLQEKKKGLMQDLLTGKVCVVVLPVLSWGVPTSVGHSLVSATNIEELVS
jgi:type I restriction enzyme S subunit